MINQRITWRTLTGRVSGTVTRFDHQTGTYLAIPDGDEQESIVHPSDILKVHRD